MISFGSKTKTKLKYSQLLVQKLKLNQIELFIKNWNYTKRFYIKL